MSSAEDFERFFTESRDRCLRAVLVASGADQAAAEDLVAEAYARAWSRWRHVCAHPRRDAWVVRTALNLRVSWWRRRRHEQLWADPPHAAAPEPDEPSDGSLLRAVARLPRRQREVVALRLLLELDTEQTAGALGIAAGTVTAHLHRALETLRTNPEGVLQR